MARGWRYTKLSLSSAVILYFSDLCFVLFVPSFLLFLSCFVFVVMLSLELCRCSSNIILSGRPRTTGLAATV